jgi:hypothetical protein
MTRKTSAVGLALVLTGGIIIVWGAGCSPELLRYLTAERTGNISVLFINDTGYRASFSYGVFDSLDRNPPGSMQFQQLRLEKKSTSDVITLTCARNLAIGTQEFYQRGLDQDVQHGSGFDPDAFDTVVHFSDAPADSELAAAATVGTAEGAGKLLGVDFTCADEIIFTFVEDPAAPGGFRIDFAVIVDKTTP